MSAGISMFPTYQDAANTWDVARPNEVFLMAHVNDPDQQSEESDSVDTISRLVDLLDENGEDDYGKIGPTQYAFQSVYRLVERAQNRMVATIQGSPVVDSMGGVSVTWRRGNLEARLVCPSTKMQQSYLYLDLGDDPQVVSGVTPATLAQHLSFLAQGGNTL